MNNPDKSNETALDAVLALLKRSYEGFDKRAGIKKGDHMFVIMGKVMLKIIAIPLFLLLSPVVLIILIVAFVVAF